MQTTERQAGNADNAQVDLMQQGQRAPCMGVLEEPAQHASNVKARETYMPVCKDASNVKARETYMPVCKDASNVKAREICMSRCMV